MTEGENCHRDARSAGTAKKEILIPHAGVVVTGDKELEAVGIYSDIRILTPSRFLGDFEMAKPRV